jgi:hypothetical protein
MIPLLGKDEGQACKILQRNEATYLLFSLVVNMERKCKITNSALLFSRGN